MSKCPPISRYSEPVLAWEYDQRNRFDRIEFDWYHRHAKHVGSPILELACGSGRLTIPFAEAGFAITGVDNAEAMLERLRQRLLPLDDEIKHRVTTVCADIVHYVPNKIYNLVLIPYNSLQYLATCDRISCTLKTVHGALSPDGLLLIVLQNRDLTSFYNGERYVVDWLDRPITDQKDGKSVATKTIEYYDADKDRIIKERTYHIRQPGKGNRIIKEKTYSPALDVEAYLSLISSAGFSAKVTGGYDECSFSKDSRIACIVCRKKG